MEPKPPTPPALKIPRETYTVQITILKKVGELPPKSLRTIVVHDAGIRVVEDFGEKDARAGHDILVTIGGTPDQGVSAVRIES